jgi:hypothetical protein
VIQLGFAEEFWRLIRFSTGGVATVAHIGTAMVLGAAAGANPAVELITPE